MLGPPIDRDPYTGELVSGDDSFDESLKVGDVVTVHGVQGPQMVVRTVPSEADMRLFRENGILGLALYGTCWFAADGTAQSERFPLAILVKST